MILIPVTLIVMLIMACVYVNADDIELEDRPYDLIYDMYYDEFEDLQITENGWKPASTKLSFIVTIVLLGLLMVLWQFF